MTSMEQSQLARIDAEAQGLARVQRHNANAKAPRVRGFYRCGDFAGKIDVFVEGGTLTSKTGSTVVEVIGDAIKIIREGEIRRSDLDEILKKDKIV